MSKKKKTAEPRLIELAWRTAVIKGDTIEGLGSWGAELAHEYEDIFFHGFDDELTLSQLQERVETWEHALGVLKKMTPHERKKHFKMEVWGLKTPCGTVACLAGHCAFDPWFNKNRGFKPIWKKLDHEDAPLEATHELEFSKDTNEVFGDYGADYILHSTSSGWKEVTEKTKTYVKQMKDFIEAYT